MAEVSEVRSASEVKPFPVLSPGDGPKWVRWDALSERMAQLNHGQSLARLAERGGLCPSEIYGNLRGVRWAQLPVLLSPEMLEEVRAIGCEGPL